MLVRFDHVLRVILNADHSIVSYGRGAGVGRGLGDGASLGVGVGVALVVAAQYLPPVLR